MLPLEPHGVPEETPQGDPETEPREESYDPQGEVRGEQEMETDGKLPTSDEEGPDGEFQERTGTRFDLTHAFVDRPL